MKESIQKLLLTPFSEATSPEDCRINALLSNDGSRLKITYELTARLADINIPDFNPARAQRKDKLWEHTCFEVFLGSMRRQDYWEFNLSPSGDWNVYSFSGYREGMKPEIYFNALPFEVKIYSGRMLELETAIDLKFLEDCSDITAGLSAVLEQKDGPKSYWAVCHRKDAPDFHAKEGWSQNPLSNVS